MRSRRATAICRDPTSRRCARPRGICILRGICGPPCPVHRGAAARPRPLAALGRIAEYYALALCSDRGYVGVLAYNHVHSDYATVYPRCEPYDLAELARARHRDAEDRRLRLWMAAQVGLRSIGETVMRKIALVWTGIAVMCAAGCGAPEPTATGEIERESIGADLDVDQWPLGLIRFGGQFSYAV